MRATVRLLGLKFQEAGEVSRIGALEGEGLVELMRGETEGLPRQCGSVFACIRKIGPIRRRRVGGRLEKVEKTGGSQKRCDKQRDQEGTV